MKKTLTLLLVLTILLGSIDLIPQTLTPLGDTYNTRFGWVMPAYMDGLAGVFAQDCKDLFFMTGTGDPYSNSISVAFFNDGELLQTRTLTYNTWSDYTISTAFEYDTVVFLNPDNKPDAVMAIYCWLHY